jgi:dephospho-CoA kinase
MKSIGLTGGIGMGKSVAVGILSQQGIPVVDTDLIARQIVEPGHPALKEVVTAFGPEVLDEHGCLKRAELAKLVFADPTARKRLEQILHPKIRAEWQGQLEGWRKEGRELGVVVIPLLYETHAEPFFDAIICMACTEKSQRERLRARGWTDQQISQRIAAQLLIEEKISRATFVVWTEGTIVSTVEQLDKIVSSLKSGTT